jgi:hypothetical protein
VTHALLQLGALGAVLLPGWLFARRMGRPWPVALALAHLCGAAALGAGLTFGIAITNQVHWLWGAAGLGALGIAGAVRRSAPATDRVEKGGPLSRWEWALAAMIAIGALTAVARTALIPVDWDGWAIWQLKARALVDGSIRELITDPGFRYSHPNYPLLVPAHTYWLCAGGFQPKVGQWGGLLFFFDLLALFYYEARARLPRPLVLAGCAVLVSWGPLVKHASSGFADVPAAAFAFATLALLADGDIPAFGVCLAGALLTKNEGLFTLAAAVSFALFCRPAEAKTSRANGAAVGLAMLLSLGSWTWVKATWHVPADMTDPHYWHAGELAARIPVIALGFVKEALAVGPWYPGWGFFWLVAPAGFIVSVRKRLRETAPFWLLVGASFAGAAAAYLVTPHDPVLHMGSSIDRLWLQAGPAALLATLMAFAPTTTPKR